MARAEATLFKPAATTPKRDPKQEAQAREEAEQEARDKLAALLRSERALALTVGSRGPITADPELVFARFACGASIETVAGELGVASDILAAWALHPERAEQFQRAMLFCGHYWGSKVVEVANDLRVLPADRRVQVEAMQWAAAKMGREFYADKAPAGSLVQVNGDGVSLSFVQVVFVEAKG